MFEMVASNELLHELQVVLLRQKFRRYLTEGEALQYILWLHEGATISYKGEIHSISRDPDDDYLLALAENSGADYLVSGDGDLLDLEEPRTPIIPPRDFHKILESSKGES